MKCDVPELNDNVIVAILDDFCRDSILSSALPSTKVKFKEDAKILEHPNW